jgi:5'-AMP-activated protein kinase catalytic alpha subunit
MIAGKHYNGLMSDLWSCGVVLYAMLCGYLPFEDQKTSDLYKKILNAEYTPPDFLSDEAKDMIARIFVTDPNERIDIEQIRKHPWYQLHRPETLSFHVCPPAVQRTRPDYIVKNNKKYTITQRFNLLNQKIIGNLEAQQGFNRESLLKSIKNNKHNHLTATYYLLLKKHTIRQLRPYCEAFLELKLREEPKDGAGTTDLNQVNLKNQRGAAQ